MEHGLSCNSKARIRGSSRIRKVEGEGEARRAKHRHPCDPHQTPRRVDSLLHHSRPCDTPTNSSQLPSQLFCCTSQKGSKIRYIIRQTFTARSALPLQSRDSSIRTISHNQGKCGTREEHDPNPQEVSPTIFLQRPFNDFVAHLKTNRSFPPVASHPTGQKAPEIDCHTLHLDAVPRK